MESNHAIAENTQRSGPSWGAGDLVGVRGRERGIPRLALPLPEQRDCDHHVHAAFYGPAYHHACSDGGRGASALRATCCAYVPQTCYRTVYSPVPVTTCQAVRTCDPCTGCPVTTFRPITTYAYRPVLVPYTTYRVVCSSPCNSCCAAPACGSCCAAPACGTCSTCGPTSACGSCGSCGTCGSGGCSSCVSGTPSAPLLPGPMPSPPTGLGAYTMPAPLGSAGSAPRATSPGAYTIPGPPSPAGGATGAPSAPQPTYGPGGPASTSSPSPGQPSPPPLPPPGSGAPNSSSQPIPGPGIRTSPANAPVPANPPQSSDPRGRVAERPLRQAAYFSPVPMPAFTSGNKAPSNVGDWRPARD